MLPDEVLQFAARHVPGTGSLNIQLVGRGLVNETYRVLRDGSAHALRVATADLPDFGVNRVWESQVLMNAGLAGIAPDMEYCDPRRGTLITRWVEGVRWSVADARLAPNIERMAELLRRVHALPVPAPPRLMTPARWIERYSAALFGGGGEVLRGMGELRSADELRSAAASRLAALAAHPVAAPVVCHSDVHVLNLIDGGPTLFLLDWEYAHAGEPLWDLAGWCGNNDLEPAVRRELLRHYLDRAPTGEDHTRLGLLSWLYDYVCWLWSALYLEPGRPEPGGQADAAHGDLAARARLLEARLSGPQHVGD